MIKIHELTYVAFDLEATCHPSLGYHEIIEIGAVKLDSKTLNVTVSFEKLIRPSTPIIKPIIEKTGITDELVKGAVSINDIWDEFRDFLGDAILVGHKVFLDIGILKKTAEREGLKLINNPALDTFRLAKRLYPREKSYGLEHFQKILGLKITTHRARADAYVTGVLFKHLVQKLEHEYGISDYKELWNFCYSQNPLQSKLF